MTGSAPTGRRWCMCVCVCVVYVQGGMHMNSTPGGSIEVCKECMNRMQ